MNDSAAAVIAAAKAVRRGTQVLPTGHLMWQVLRIAFLNLDRNRIGAVRRPELYDMRSNGQDQLHSSRTLWLVIDEDLRAERVRGNPNSPGIRGSTSGL